LLPFTFFLSFLLSFYSSLPPDILFTPSPLFLPHISRIRIHLRIRSFMSQVQTPLKLATFIFWALIQMWNLFFRGIVFKNNRNDHLKRNSVWIYLIHNCKIICDIDFILQSSHISSLFFKPEITHVSNKRFPSVAGLPNLHLW
jgi:hypothetical protein